MKSHVAVQKVNDWLYRAIWITNTNSYNRNTYDSLFDCSSTMKLTSLNGVEFDEHYLVECSMLRNLVYGYDRYLSLKLVLITSDESIKQRKLTARFSGYEKEMRLRRNSAQFLNPKILNKSTVQPEVCYVRKISLIWEAIWTEITTTNFSKFCSNLAKTFEIIIEMDPTFSLGPGQKCGLKHLRRLWESKTMADITFKCENRDVKAHSVIISSGSPVLAAMFQNDFKEKREQIAVIQEIKAEVFERLLFFIYTGRIDVEFEDTAALIDVMVAAGMYDVASLKDECELYLSKHLSVENATSYLILAHFHDANRLHKATLKYMQRNYEAICTRQDWKNLLKDHLDLGIQATQFLAKKIEPIKAERENEIRRAVFGDDFDDWILYKRIRAIFEKERARQQANDI